MSHVLVNAMSLRPGGGLQVILGLLTGFSRNNQYTVILSDPRSGEILRRELAGYDNIRFDFPIGVVGNLRVFLWQMRKLKLFARRVGADVVLSVNHHFPLGDIPQVIYHLSMLRFEREIKPFWKPGEIQDKLRDWRTASASRYAEANVLESNYLHELAKKRYGSIRNAHTIYIGLDDRQIGKIKAVRNEAPKTPAILAVTSPQPHKDNGTLVRMLAELSSQRKDVSWQLKIAGGREGAFDDLKQLATSLGVIDHIEWLGFVSHEELSDIAAECLCLVSTSLKESFSMVALEAMSWGCPAIVADTTSMPESVGDAGLLATAGDAADFARKVIRLKDARDLRETLVKAGLERAARNTWSDAAMKFEALFDSLISDC